MWRVWFRAARVCGSWPRAGAGAGGGPRGGRPLLWACSPGRSPSPTYLTQRVRRTWRPRTLWPGAWGTCRWRLRRRRRRRPMRSGRSSGTWSAWRSTQASKRSTPFRGTPTLVTCPRRCAWPWTPPSTALTTDCARLPASRSARSPCSPNQACPPGGSTPLRTKNRRTGNKRMRTQARMRRLKTQMRIVPLRTHISH